MMMALGLFLFEIGTMPYQELTRSQSWNHAETMRFGARPVSQFTGPGNDSISLSGALYPGYIGTYSAIDTIRAMADAGEDYVLLDGLGNVLGSFYIPSLEVKTTTFFVDGVARRADFTLTLKRAPDPQPHTVAEISAAEIDL